MGFRVIWGNAWAWAWASGVGVWGSGWFGAMHARGVACLHGWHIAGRLCRRGVGWGVPARLLALPWREELGGLCWLMRDRC